MTLDVPPIRTQNGISSPHKTRLVQALTPTGRRRAAAAKTPTAHPIAHRTSSSATGSAYPLHPQSSSPVNTNSVHQASPGIHAPSSIASGGNWANLLSVQRQIPEIVRPFSSATHNRQPLPRSFTPSPENQHPGQLESQFPRLSYSSLGNPITAATSPSPSIFPPYPHITATPATTVTVLPQTTHNLVQPPPVVSTDFLSGLPQNQPIHSIPRQQIPIAGLPRVGPARHSLHPLASSHPVTNPVHYASVDPNEPTSTSANVSPDRGHVGSVLSHPQNLNNVFRAPAPSLATTTTTPNVIMHPPHQHRDDLPHADRVLTEISSLDEFMSPGILSGTSPSVGHRYTANLTSSMVGSANPTMMAPPFSTSIGGLKQLSRRTMGGAALNGSGPGGASRVTDEAAGAVGSNPALSSSGEDFELMVGDLRRTFIGWLKKTESDLRKEKDRLAKQKEEFMAERERVVEELERYKKSEEGKREEERRQAAIEIANATKQLTVEREDARRRINEDRSKFDYEKDQSRRKMLLEKEKFRQELEMFEKERKRIVDVAIATDTMADVNVGGVVFQSARHTLTQQPGSFLEAIFCGRHKIPRDKQGRFFLDRDAELFRTILNFLRDPTTPPVPRDATESEMVLREAAYFGIKFFPFPLVFACGGHNGTEHLRALEVLDVGQQCWRPCRPMETERAYFGSADLYGRLYAFGGQNLDYKALCDVEVYDALRDVWTAGPAMNVARRNNVGIAFSDRIFAIGGFDGSVILESVEAYDPRMKGWHEVAPLSTPRSSAMTAIHGDRIYALGGTRGERLRTVEFYDSRANKWAAADIDMIEIRSAGCACTVGNEIVVFGGTNSQHDVHSSLESIDPSNNTSWSFRKSMKFARMDAACAAVSHCVVVTGGQHGDVLGSCEFYRPDMDEWQSGPDMLFPRYGHCLMTVNI